MLKRILLCLLILTLMLTVLVSCTTLPADGAAETDAKADATDTVLPETETAYEDETPALTEYDNMVLKFTYGEDKYYTVRKTLWTEDFDMGLDFKYLGEIGEEIDGVLLDGILVPQDGTVYVTEENSFVPKDTPVYITEDGDFVRVAFWGVSYYLRLREKTEPVDPMDVTDIGYPISKLCYKDEYYVHTNELLGGGLWKFKLDEDWSFVGIIRSEVDAYKAEYDKSEITEELNDLEANFHLGKPVYYNEKLDRIAILVEDDNYAYSDIDWEILVNAKH